MAQRRGPDLGKKQSKNSPVSAPSTALDLKAITRRLRGNPKRLRTTFSEVRGNVSPNFYPALVTEFRDNPFYRLKIFGEAFPLNPSQLKRLQPLQPIGTVPELRWAEGLILHYQLSLKEMLDFRVRILALVQADAYEEASVELERLNAAHGISLWGYSLRFVLQSRLLGPDANNNTYSDLRNTPGINGLVYFILFYLGFRTSPGSTVQHIRDQVPSPEQVGESLSLYISQKLTPFTYEASRSQSGLVEASIRHETNSSAFDLACALSRGLCISLEQKELPTSVVGASVARLGKQFTPQTYAIAATLSPSVIEYDARTEQVFDALDEITNSDFELENGGIARLLAALGWHGKLEGGLTADIATHLTVLSSISGERQAAADNIEHLCTTLSVFDEACCIFGLARRLWLAPGCLSLFGSLEGVLTSGFTLPDAAEFIEDDELAAEYLNTLERVYGTRPSISVFQALRLGRPSTLPPGLTAFVETLRAKKQGESDQALERIRAATSPSSPALNVNALRARLEYDTDALNSAVVTIAKACTGNRHNWASMPVVEVVEAVIKSEAAPADMLSWSLVLDIATEHFDAKYARQRSYAVEDAWEGRGVASPSAIAALLTVDEKALGTAYLRSLCTADILSDSDQFQTVRELEEERIRVCQALTELDPGSAETYLSEIKSITRWLVIYDGLRTVEQSKVYVDIEGLRDHLLATAGPEYDRMLALRRERSAIGDIDHLLKKDVIKYRDDEIVGNLLLRYAFEDPLKILRYLLLTVFNEYAANSRFGLDVYLSTRIRHGTLKGHLRSPLEDHRLMCQRSGGHYQDQPHWVQRISEVSAASELGLLKAIKDFSQNIDEDIAQLNSRHLRLRSEENPEGWFDMSPLEVDLTRADEFLGQQQPAFAEFLNLAFNGLNSILERQLEQVQDQLRFALRQRWTRRLRDLREATQVVTSGQLRSEFDAAIAAAQVAVDLAIDRVASWFALSAAQENPDYSVGLAIDIASRSIDNCFGSSVLTVQSNEDEGPLLRGRTLASLVDMFFILFENIVKHAKEEASAAVADVAVSRKDRFYTIIVGNSLDADFDRARLSERLLSIRESLSLNNEDRLVTEGGTGYHKLRKILEHDLQVEHDFDFGVEDSRYEVTIILDAEAVLA